MNGFKERPARKLVEQLESSGMNSGLLAVQGSVVLRCPGSPYTDTPMMFDETDLQNAVALDLLEKRKVTGSFDWEWYVSRRKPTSIPKLGDWIVLSDGMRARIDGVEKGVAF